MRRILLITVGLLPFLTGSVAACSLAGPVPGPGHFYLFDPETGSEADIAVRQRGLGATCELSNPFAFDGTRFAWVEGPELYDDAARDSIHVIDENGKEQTLAAQGLRHLALSLTPTHLLHLSQQASGGPVTLWRHRLSDHAETLVPIAVPNHASMDGALAAWHTNDAKRLHVYDMVKQRWILRDQTAADLGVSGQDQLQVQAVGDEFLLFATWRSTDAPTKFRSFAFEFGVEKTHELDERVGGTHGATIDGAHIYGVVYEESERHLKAWPARGGAARDLGPLPHETGRRLDVAAGRIVLAAYANHAAHKHVANPDAHGWDTSPDPSTGFPIPTPGPLAILGIVGASAFLILRGRR